MGSVIKTKFASEKYKVINKNLNSIERMIKFKLYINSSVKKTLIELHMLELSWIEE